MTVFTREASKLLTEFHRDVNSRVSKVGAGLAGLHMLQQQLGVYENIIKDLANTVKGTINNTQKDINREFTPVIERAMTAAYDACAAEAGMYLLLSREAKLILAGPGSYARMKAAMQAHVDQERHVMFELSADEAKRRLIEMVEGASMTISDRIDEVFVAMRRDYRSVLGGGDTQGEILPKSQRILRKQVMMTLDGVEQLFKIALGQATDDDCNSGGMAKKLEENKRDQDFDDVDDALSQQKAASDAANRQFKSEGGEYKDVRMNDIPGSASRTEENSVPNNQVFNIDCKPQFSDDQFPASTGQENVKVESISEHTEDAYMDQSTLGQPQPPLVQGTPTANNTDQQEDSNDYSGSHEDEDEDENAEYEEEILTESDPSEVEMDSFESFPHSYGSF